MDVMKPVFSFCHNSDEEYFSSKHFYELCVHITSKVIYAFSWLMFRKYMWNCGVF